MPLKIGASLKKASRILKLIMGAVIQVVLLLLLVDSNSCTLMHSFYIDPKTKDFLKKSFDPMFGFPTFARFSWSTIKNIMEEKAISCEW